MNWYIYIYIYISAPKRLKLPCVGFSSQGRATIARIRGGLLPSGLSYDIAPGGSPALWPWLLLRPT